MTILDQIRKDALTARKEKRREASLLTTLIGEIETRTKALKEPRPLTDEEVVGIVRKFLKGAEETLAAVETRRPEEADRLRADIRTLEAYLPTQLSEDELRAYAAARVRAGDGMGQVMAALKADFPGRYDGKLASAVVRGLLAA
jgi:uncharacterized protein YqeY